MTISKSVKAVLSSLDDEQKLPREEDILAISKRIRSQSHELLAKFLN